jgi:hypothetical protein
MFAVFLSFSYEHMVEFSLGCMTCENVIPLAASGMNAYVFKGSQVCFPIG